MIQAHSETVSPGLGVVETVGIVYLVVVLQVGGTGTLLFYILGGIAVQIVSAQVHAVVEKSPGAVASGHPGSSDSVVVPVAAAASAHAAATASHAAHHGTGEVVEAAVVGIVAVGYERDLGFVGEFAHKCRSLIAPVTFYVGGRQVMAASGHNIAEGSFHHAGLDAEVDYGLFFSVVNSGELGLVGLLVHDFELVDYLGGNVLGSQLRIVQEESLSVNSYPFDSLSVVSNAAILGHFYAGQFLEEVFEHVVVGGLERCGVVLDSVFLDDDGVADSRHRRGVKLLLVHFHLDGSQILDIWNLDLLFEGLVTQHFGLEGVGSRPYAFYGHLAVRLAEHVLCGLLGSLTGK